MLSWHEGVLHLSAGADYASTPTKDQAAHAYALALSESQPWQAPIVLDVFESPERSCVWRAPSGPRTIPQPAELLDITSQAPAVLWQDRAPIAHWRGPLAGEASTLKQVMQLPRLRLCLLTRMNQNIDARLTGLGAFGAYGEPLSEALVGLDLLDLSSTVPSPPRRYAIDIAGDATHRSPMREALASCCPVRIGTTRPEWYEHLLQPGVHFASVETLKDLPAQIQHLERSGQGRAIAAAAAKLEAQLTPQRARAALRALVSAG